MEFFSNFSIAYLRSMTSFFSFCDGISNMASFNIASMIAIKPRAPSLNSMLLSTIYSKTSSFISRLMSSISKSFENCLMIAFLGSFNILTNDSLSNGLRNVNIGKRPTISGIRPNHLMSAGVMYFNRLSLSICFLLSLP